ncbi:MAG: histidine phosphatase family protein [Lachnospiraceae bacterium]|nr:histidine phosphatase family protein [Lachnospiraceae bacterium]
MNTVYIWIFRHGATAANLERRFLGITDEPILQEEQERLKAVGARGYVKTDGGRAAFSKAEMPLYVSPMLRARMSADALFPGRKQTVVPDFREMDFGVFEYKNHAELDGNPAYQAYIDSEGMLPFPGGESLEEFQERTCAAFLGLDLTSDSVIVAHGGTIMALLDRFSRPHEGYFNWLVPNGGGYRVQWNKERPEMTDMTAFW